MERFVVVLVVLCLVGLANAATEKVIIIGSGPAGHTAAIYCARARLEPLMFEGFMSGGVPGGQLMITTDVENYPGFEQSVAGPDLMAKFRSQSERFGTRILTQEVKSVNLARRPFKVVSSEGETHYAEALIIATGATARWLGLDSERRLYNRGVSACATCDGASPLFRDKTIVVIGGGDSAMEEATFLTRFASKVVIIHRRNDFRASEIMIERAKENPKIEFKTPFVVTDIHGQDLVSGVQLKNVETGEEEEFETSGVFMAIGHVPNTAVFNTTKLKLDSEGYIVTKDKSTYTNIVGVFAAGDVADKTYRQAVTAAGSGCSAAIDVERWLESQKKSTKPC